MVAAGSSAEANLPITTAQLIAFLSTFPHDERGIRHDLIPMLDRLARSGPKGEAVLSALDCAGAEDDPLENYMKAEATSDEIKPKTVELVYMLYVCAVEGRTGAELTLGQVSEVGAASSRSDPFHQVNDIG